MVKLPRKCFDILICIKMVAALLFFLKEFMENLENQKHGMYILNQLKNMIQFSRTPLFMKVYNYDGKQKSVAHLVQDLEI